MIVLISYGISEIVAHILCNFYYLICFRHLIISRAVTYQICFLRKDLFSFLFAQNVLSYHLIYKYHGARHKELQQTNVICLVKPDDSFLLTFEGLTENKQCLYYARLLTIIMILFRAFSSLYE